MPDHGPAGAGPSKSPINFAVLEILGTCFSWLFLIIIPLLTLLLPDDPEFEPLTSEYWMTIGVVLLIGHTIDALTTHNFARKGHYPQGAAPAQASLPPKVIPG